MIKRKKNNRAKALHKWHGVPISLFALLFALSGIILNHRDLIPRLEVSRSLLPNYLSVHNWNQSSVKTTINLGNDSILMYGAQGIWLTNQRHSFVEKYEAGMKRGVDNRNTAKIVKTTNGDIFAVTTFDLYNLDTKTNTWNNISHLINNHERLTDATLVGDTLVVLSRSNVFSSEYPYDKFTKSTLKSPVDYDGKVSLFRTIWRLHSGELFGEFGKIIVDLLGVAVIIFSITGLIIFIFPKIVRRLKSKGKKFSGYIATLRPDRKSVV